MGHEEQETWTRGEIRDIIREVIRDELKIDHFIDVRGGRYDVDIELLLNGELISDVQYDI
jgi:hypothetical protein